jgi:hypothetical protein
MWRQLLGAFRRNTKNIKLDKIRKRLHPFGASPWREIGSALMGLMSFHFSSLEGFLFCPKYDLFLDTDYFLT